MNITKSTLVFSLDMKSVTVIGVNGARTTIVAQSTLSFWARKDGGFTFSVDGEHRSQTVRVDRYGRITTKAAQGADLPKSKGRRLSSVA